MKINRLMIAAPKSGSGKTIMTCALLQTFKDMGQKVISFKCGPDYIDPMFHRKVIGIPSKNLDTFFTGEEKTKKIFEKSAGKADIAVLEGVMGLFDGLSGVREEGSSYHLAKVTKTPVILVIDAKGMGRSVIPLIGGFLAYDSEHLIKGVILNRMSKGYYEMIRPLIEKELDIAVVGYFPDKRQFQIESRHLGLKMPTEMEDIKEKLKEVSEEIQMTVSIKQIMEIAKAAADLSCEKVLDESPKKTPTEDAPVIAVAKDEAFCFFYEDNLRLLQEYGAKIAYFSPIHDQALPYGCSGILLVGGYPELYAAELSKNTAMREDIRKKIEDGMPVVAECGGFMYLHKAIRTQDDHSYPMVGAVLADCYDTGKLVRFGYIEIQESGNYFLGEGERIRGHEFHYYDSEKNGNDCTAIKPVTGRSYPCVIAGKDHWMGFPHLYYPSNPLFAKRFVEKTIEYRQK